MNVLEHDRVMERQGFMMGGPGTVMLEEDPEVSRTAGMMRNGDDVLEELSGTTDMTAKEKTTTANTGMVEEVRPMRKMINGMVEDSKP